MFRFIVGFVLVFVFMKSCSSEYQLLKDTYSSSLNFLWVFFIVGFPILIPAFTSYKFYKSLKSKLLEKSAIIGLSIISFVVVHFACFYILQQFVFSRPMSYQAYVSTTYRYFLSFF